MHPSCIGREPARRDLRTPRRRFCPSYQCHRRVGGGRGPRGQGVTRFASPECWGRVFGRGTKVRPKDPLTSTTRMSNICASRRRDFAAKSSAPANLAPHVLVAHVSTTYNQTISLANVNYPYKKFFPSIVKVLYKLRNIGGSLKQTDQCWLDGRVRELSFGSYKFICDRFLVEFA